MTQGIAFKHFLCVQMHMADSSQAHLDESCVCQGDKRGRCVDDRETRADDIGLGLTSIVGDEAFRVLGPGPVAGERVGAFRLVRELVRGGMGVDWLAERADGQVSAARSVAPRRLRRQIEGDLDTLVPMALSKEPERRYGSVEALSASVGRALQHLPLHARPDGWTDRAGRFLRRHAVASATTVLLAALLATQASNFLVSVFKGANPIRARGSELNVRDLLRDGVHRVRSEFAGAPQVRAP